MNEYDIQLERYRAQGYDACEARRRAERYMYNRVRYERQKKVRDAIKQMKIDDPARYARFVYEIEHAEEIAAEDREKTGRLREELERLAKVQRLRYGCGLVITGVPNVDFSSVEGMVAFRTWNVKEDFEAHFPYDPADKSQLVLGSTAMSGFWKSQMIADKIPKENNTHGLYCVMLDPLGLMTRAASYFGDVCGLLELRGRILVHTDGVVRAEWARIICVFIQANVKTENIYGGLRQSYPTVPLYVLHKEQIAEVLLRVTVLQSMRRESN